MVNQVKVSIKIKALIAFVMPILYYLMFLPVWNGNEFKITKIDIIDIIQIASFVIAVINLFLIIIPNCVQQKNKEIIMVMERSPCNTLLKNMME